MTLDRKLQNLLKIASLLGKILYIILKFWCISVLEKNTTVLISEIAALSCLNNYFRNTASNSLVLIYKTYKTSLALTLRILTGLSLLHLKLVKESK